MMIPSNSNSNEIKDTYMRTINSSNTTDIGQLSISADIAKRRDQLIGKLVGSNRTDFIALISVLRHHVNQIDNNEEKDAIKQVIDRMIVDIKVSMKRVREIHTNVGQERDMITIILDDFDSWRI